jgi:hypothetical protein
VDDRTGEFLAWARSAGLHEERLPDYRRIGAEIFERAVGRRVNESLVLALVDEYQQTPAAALAVPLIQEVGEAIIRFQDGATTLSGKGPPTNRPRRPRPPSIPVVDAIPTSTPLAPPTPAPASAPAAAVPEPRPGQISAPQITFLPRPTSVSQPPRPASVTQPPPRPTSTTIPPRPTSSVRIKAQGQFRCPQCHVFVTANEAGVCPTCGATPPQLTSSSSSPVIETPRPLVTPLRIGIAVLLAGGAAAIAIPKLSHRARPTEDAGVTQVWSGLGLRATFPHGWRHVLGQDKAMPLTGKLPYVPMDASARRATFVDGDRKRTVLVAVSLRTGEPDALFHTIDPERPVGPIGEAVTALTGEPVALAQCLPLELGLGPAVHCTGTAGAHGAVAYLAAPSGQLVAMLLESDVPDDPDARDGDDIAGSLAQP